MADILKRQLAPFDDAAWAQIDDQARTILKRCMAARWLVDFNGPMGWEFSAVNLGRLDPPGKRAAYNVDWCTRRVAPLIETRTAFKLSRMELDNIARGSHDIDLDPVSEAAKAAASFEDSAVFNGFASGGIEGIIESSGHKPLKLPTRATDYPAVISQAVELMLDAGVEGPYALVLPQDKRLALLTEPGPGYPPSRQVAEIIQGEILDSPALSDGVLLSTRGGDFELTVGVDHCVGFNNATNTEVELFMAESFMFRVLEPKAAIVLKAPKGG